MRSHSDGAPRRFTRLGRSAPAAVPGRAAEPNSTCEAIGSERLLQRIRSKCAPAYLGLEQRARAPLAAAKSGQQDPARRASASAARPSAPAGSRYST